MFISLLVGGLFIVGGGMGVLWKLGIRSQTPKRKPIHMVPKQPFEQITIKSKDSSTLHGWLFKNHKLLNDKGESPLIILVHGWASNRLGMMRYVPTLYEQGYSILMFDVRGHGESDGTKALTVKTFREDVLSVIHYVRSREDIDHERLGILAHSFGAFGSLLAIRHEVPVKALVTDSMPVRFSTIMKAALSQYKLPYFPLGPILAKMMFLRAGIRKSEMEELNALTAVAQSTVPMFLIHSKNDDYVPPAELEYILKNKEVAHLFVNSEGHRSSEKDPAFWEHVLPFLNRHVFGSNKS